MGIIKNILRPYFEKYDFFMYGSRVTGKFQKNSDLDILIQSKNNEISSLDDIEEIKQKFDKSDLPFIVHFSDFYQMDKEFYRLISDNLKKIRL